MGRRYQLDDGDDRMNPMGDTNSTPLATGAVHGTDFAQFDECVEAGVDPQDVPYVDIGGNCPGPVLSTTEAMRFAVALLAAVAWTEAQVAARRSGATTVNQCVTSTGGADS